jgi:hypothetical protein
MRPMLATIAATAAILCCQASAGHAYGNGPWCAVADTGGGNVVWDCHYRSIEECRPMVIAGNRGYCLTNPNWYSPQGRRRHRDWD